MSVLVLAGTFMFSLLAAGGNLEPSGPPGPTMKTLAEVEPRIPIAASSTPVGAFAITRSGSYYLTGDRYASGTGIIVEANDVTIDLMGYSLIGPGSRTNYGIYMKGRSNVEVRNGTVRRFGLHGIYEASSAGKEHRVIAVRAVSNGGHGMYLLGYGHLVKDCTAADNGINGIIAYPGSGSTVTGNTAYGNTNFGIYTFDYCLIDQNTAYGNGTNMYTGTGCVLGTNCAP